MELIFSVVIPVLNEEKRIKECLESLVNQDFDSQKYEIIIIDNGCIDNTVNIAKEFDVKIVEEKKKGITFARQKGLKVSKGKYYITTDADARVPKDWLKNAQTVFDSDPEIDYISGPTRSYDASSLFVKKMFYPSSMVLPKLFNHPHGCNMAFKTEVLHEVGGFLWKDYKFFEDGIIAVKLSKGGYNFKFDKNFVNYISARRYDGWKSFAAFRNLLNDISLRYTGKMFSDNLPSID